MQDFLVDNANRIRLPMLNPGDYYTPELLGENEILLRKVGQAPTRMTKGDILEALESSPIEFTASWDDLKAEVR